MKNSYFYQKNRKMTVILCRWEFIWYFSQIYIALMTTFLKNIANWSLRQRAANQSRHGWPNPYLAYDKIPQPIFSNKSPQNPKTRPDKIPKRQPLHTPPPTHLVKFTLLLSANCSFCLTKWKKCTCSKQSKLEEKLPPVHSPRSQLFYQHNVG